MGGSSRSLRDAHLRDDETVAKMGTRVVRVRTAVEMTKLWGGLGAKTFPAPATSYIGGTLRRPRLPMTAFRFVPALVLSLASLLLFAQEGFGPIDHKPLPADKTAEQIIKRMGEREAEFAAARNDYIYKQTVVVQTISDDNGKPDGEYRQESNITFGRDGKRAENVTFAPQNTLERVMMSPSDFRDIEQRLPFILTTEQLPQYDITYLGQQKVDELDTFVFDVKPKVLEKGKRYFQGKIWVDQQDLQIVVVSGLNVPQDTRRGHEDLSPPFTTYYQQIDGKYWFPTYTKAEGNLHFAAQNGALSQDVHLKTIVRYTEYKRFRAKVTIQYNGQDLPTDEQQKEQPKDTKKPK